LLLHRAASGGIAAAVERRYRRMQATADATHAGWHCGVGPPCSFPRGLMLQQRFCRTVANRDKRTLLPPHSLLVPDPNARAEEMHLATEPHRTVSSKLLAIRGAFTHSQPECVRTDRPKTDGRSLHSCFSVNAPDTH
jgi:hypothetical protein